MLMLRMPAIKIAGSTSTRETSQFTEAPAEQDFGCKDSANSSLPNTQADLSYANVITARGQQRSHCASVSHARIRSSESAVCCSHWTLVACLYDY